MPTPQILAQQILDRITQHPDSFDMESWFFRPGNDDELPAEAPIECGTTMCLAGWAAHLSGWTLTHTLNWDVDWSEEGAVVTVHAEKDGVTRDIASLAMELLDAPSEELFHTTDETAIEHLRQLAGIAD